MDNKVNFLRGTSAEYEAKTKDNDTFYYTTDTKKLYLGENEVGNGIDPKVIQAHIDNQIIHAKVWRGTQEEYNAIEPKEDDTVYIIKDSDNTLADKLIDDTSTTATDKTWSAKKINENDEVARTAINTHAGNDEIHVTAEEKAAWNGKAELADIPTSLPANGGNATTVNGKTVEMSVYRSISSLGVSSSDTADTVWKAIPPSSIFAIEAQTFTDPSWNFPAGTNQYSLLMIKLSNVRPLGMYLYPKSGGNVFFANVDTNGAYAGNWRRLCDGGDAETVRGYSSNHILKYIASLPSKDCNDITEPGWYSFNGCDGHAPGSNSTISSGTYFILLNVPMSAPGYFVQIATFVHGSANYLGRTYIRHCNNGVWSDWDELIRRSDFDALAARVTALEGGTT